MRRASNDDKSALVDKVEAFIFDCDGEPARWLPPCQHGCEQLAGAASTRPLDALPACDATDVAGPGSLFLTHWMLYAGVIWRGDSVIDGVPETLDYLRAKAGGAAAGAP